MPELPEVETIRRDLEKKILNKKIVQINIKLSRIIKNKTADFKKILINNKFTKLERLGKLLIIHTSQPEKLLLAHLKMTGQLIYKKQDKIIGGGHSDKNQILDFPNRHTRVVFKFIDGSFLFFNDQRTFGYLEIINKNQLANKTRNYGVDLMNGKLEFEWFKAKIKSRKTSIKAVLLDQKFLAGIGNIYADEILFQARIKPWRKASSLNIQEVKNIFKAIKPILNKAIKFRGTTFNNYRDSDGNKGDFLRLLKVFGRSGEPCKRCKTGIIRKNKVAGRGTHYCDNCQV